MIQYDAVAWMIPVDSGLKKTHIWQILDLLPEKEELIPFEIHESNSLAYGFATAALIDVENGLETITDLLAAEVEDWSSDTSEFVTTLPSGKTIYMGCDFRTVVFRPEE